MSVKSTRASHYQFAHIKGIDTFEVDEKIALLAAHYTPIIKTFTIAKAADFFCQHTTIALGKIPVAEDPDVSH